MPTTRSIPNIGMPIWQYIKTICNRGGNESNAQLIRGQQPVQTVFSAADFIAMNATPVVALALPTVNSLPTANTVVLPYAATLQVTPGSANFTGGGAISLVYAGGSVSPVVTIPATALTSGTSGVAVLNHATSLATAFQPVAGVGLNLTNATAAFAAGNGTGILTVWYDLLIIN